MPPLTLHVLSCARACKFWQAFAKSVGSYLALESGLSSEALEDITGCPSVRMAFDDPVVKDQVDSGALFDTLRLCDQVSYAGRGGSWKPVHPRSTHGGALISICHQLFGDSCWTATSTTCMLRVHNSLCSKGASLRAPALVKTAGARQGLCRWMGPGWWQVIPVFSPPPAIAMPWFLSRRVCFFRLPVEPQGTHTLY